MSSDRFKLTPAVYLILVREGRILMLRRFNTGYEDGNYSLVAGHLDGSETFVEGMIREAREEAGLVIKPGDLEVIHMMHRRKPDEPEDERLDVFLKAEEWRGEPENLEPHKCDDMAWFELSDLPDNTIPYIRAAIQHFREENFYSEHGWD